MFKVVEEEGVVWKYEVEGLRCHAVVVREARTPGRSAGRPGHTTHTKASCRGVRSPSRSVVQHAANAAWGRLRATQRASQGDGESPHSGGLLAGPFKWPVHRAREHWQTGKGKVVGGWEKQI